MGVSRFASMEQVTPGCALEGGREDQTVVFVRVGTFAHAVVEVPRFSGVSELALEVSDLQAAERFYTEALGLPVVDRWPEAVWLLSGSTRLGLWLSFKGIAGARGGAHVHFALHVTEAEYDAVVDRLRTHGFDPHEETFEAFERSRAAYVTDPDGNVVEFWTWDVTRHLGRSSQT
jgi:catechol 2,3-dioxygenase-like lactoylglutathione lyase family enzyme